MVDEKKKKKTATPSESGRHSTLDSTPQKSTLWWIDPDYHEKVPPILHDDSAPGSKEFVAYRSFLIEKGLSEYDGQTLRYMVVLEDEYREKIRDCSEQLDTAINSHNQLQEQYTLLRDEKTALQIQLADFDEKNILEEITSLREEKAALEGQLADTERQLADTKRHQDDTRTPDVDEKLMEQVLDLRQELAASRASTAAAQAAVVQAVNLRSSKTLGAGASFHINPRRLPTYDGTRDAKAIVDFLSDIKRAFGLRCHEIGWLRDGQPEEDGWSPYAIARLRGAAGRWADGKYPPLRLTPKWADFERSPRGVHAFEHGPRISREMGRLEACPEWTRRHLQRGISRALATIGPNARTCSDPGADGTCLHPEGWKQRQSRRASDRIRITTPGYGRRFEVGERYAIHREVGPEGSKEQGSRNYRDVFEQQWSQPRTEER
jgi:hypothetical protein